MIEKQDETGSWRAAQAACARDEPASTMRDVIPTTDWMSTVKLAVSCARPASRRIRRHLARTVMAPRRHPRAHPQDRHWVGDWGRRHPAPSTYPASRSQRVGLPWIWEHGATVR